MGLLSGMVKYSIIKRIINAIRGRSGRGRARGRRY